MNLPIFRLIFKEVQALRRKEPRIAESVSVLIRTHIQQYKQQLPRMASKLKKQDDRALAQAFLSFMQLSNKEAHDVHSNRYLWGYAE